MNEFGEALSDEAAVLASFVADARTGMDHPSAIEIACLVADQAAVRRRHHEDFLRGWGGEHQRIEALARAAEARAARQRTSRDRRAFAWG